MALAHDAQGLLWAAEFRADPARLDTSLHRYGLAADPVPVAAPAPLATAFARYFAGELHALEQLPTGTVGSAFERAVWAELRRIPPGETRSYGDIARALGGASSGRPKVSGTAAGGPNARAVGTANGRNPLAIIVPCHRVIGADGSLTGYAGGLETKAWLLKHEGWRGLQPTLF